MKKVIPIIGVIMSTALVLAACGGGAPTTAPEATRQPVEQAAAQPTQPPAQQPATVDSPTATPEVLELANVTAGLGELDSYKASLSMAYSGIEDGGASSSILSIMEEVVKDPPAKRTIITGFSAMFSGTGAASSDQSTGAAELIEVGGKEYIKTDAFCMQRTAENAPRSNTLLDPGSVIGDIRSAQFVGHETVNGIPTAHYKTNSNNASFLTYVSGSGDVWIAKQGGFVVKSTFDGNFKDNSGMFCNITNLSADETKIKCQPDQSEFNMKWNYEVTNINQPINIQVPENCGGAAGDIPMMADAQDAAVIGDMNTYSSPSAFEDVVAFYEKEMKSKGWTETEGSGVSAEGLSMKNYIKDGRTVQIIITADTSGGMTSVTITEEK
jgi:predicted small lipoprotein YifL